MKKQLMLTAAFLALSATMATADTIDDIVAALTAEGYERIHIRPGTDAIRVAAIKDGVRLDVAYDSDTGEVLSERTREARADDEEGNGRLRAASEDGEARPPRGPRGPRAATAETDAEAGDDDARPAPPPRRPRADSDAGEGADGERRGPPRLGPRPPRGEDTGTDAAEE